MILTENKKANFDYNILEKFEAGLVLNGQEVKSLKTRGSSLAGSYIMLKKNNRGRTEAFWTGANIPAYQPLNLSQNYDPQRDRKLLLHKKELNYLIGKSKERGLTLIPLSVYTKKGKIKISLGLAKGKKKTDKREFLKKRDIEKTIRRELKMRG